jgi:hypothetical protein
MILKEKARKSGAPMFEYNGKKYFKNKLPTGMVIYSRKKPSGMSGGMGCGGPSHKKKSGGPSHKKKSGGKSGCSMTGGFTLRKKGKSSSKSKPMKKHKFHKKSGKKHKKSGKK